MANVSILSPSYFCSKEEIKKVKENLEKMGFGKINDFVPKDVLFDKWAGSFDERLNNFYNAWNSDSEVIMCCKGGSGASHFLPLIKAGKLKKKKMFVGYSDITLLLNFISKKLGIVTIHGPNGLKKLDKETLSALKDALQMKNYGIRFTKKQCVNISKPILEGKTIGGNLERLAEALYYVRLNFNNKIVFLEETGHTEHKIFNLLVFLKNNPSFNPRVLVFGGLGIKNKKLMREMIISLFPDIPLIFDLSFGHTTPNITIPIGVDCKIDFEKELISFFFSNKDRKYSVKF
jgi:muramoyltetrapeptide carboxypeptidase